MATLVIGDGNFSFSLSLARRVGSECTGTIVATSLETEQEVSGRTVVQENVKQLRKLGVCILHEVDGTKLETEPRLVSLGLHSTVPSSSTSLKPGGKSNIKRNRQLLRDFFVSTKSVMAPRGCVRVTLCSGQGGTPADSTQRGYHNSWRIVEMAAEAGLVLSRVHPFTLSSYPGYVPTGYRGAGKGFVLDGALEHTFTLPQLDDWSWTERDGDRFYDVCQYCEGVSSGDLEVQIQATGLSEFLHCLLLSLPWHPVTRTRRVLLRALRQLEQGLWSGVWSEVRERVTVHRVPSLCCPSYHKEDVLWHVNSANSRTPGSGPSYTDCDSTESTHHSTQSTCNTGPTQTPYNAGPTQSDCSYRPISTGEAGSDGEAVREEVTVVGETGCEGEGLGEEVNQQTLTLQSSPHQLLPSLLDRMCSDCHTTTCTTTGPVLRTVTCCTVRETVVSPHPALQPVSHWLCGVLPLSASSEAHTLVPSLRHSVLQALRTILPDTSLHSVSCGDMRSLWQERPQLSSHFSLTLTDCHRLIHREEGEEEEGEGEGGGVVRESGQEQTHLVFTVHLDTLALVSHALPHINLLWSHDRRFVEQFHSRDDSQHITFHPFSLFPPHYYHDISFWVPPQLSSAGDEWVMRERVDGEMGRAVRSVAGLRAVSVTRVDTYRAEWAVGEWGGGEGEGEREQVKGEGGVDGERRVKRGGVVGNRGSVEGERGSVCYCVEYSSAGEALSRSVARELQLRVRERLTRQVEGWN